MRFVGEALAFGKGCCDKRDVYEGEYRDGEKDGLGCLTYADRSQHVGMFVAGRPEGDCTFIDADEREYKGVWVSKMELGDGSTYDGLWKRGKADGFGKLRYRDGATYEGEWCGCGCLNHEGGTAIKLINVIICTKDPSSPARRRAWDDMFGLPVMNMKESGRRTSPMERARRRGRTAIRTRVSVRVVYAFMAVD